MGEFGLKSEENAYDVFYRTHSAIHNNMDESSAKVECGVAPRNTRCIAGDFTAAGKNWILPSLF